MYKAMCSELWGNFCLAYSVMLLFIIIVLIIRPSLWYSSDDWKLHVGWSLQERIPNWDQSWQPVANLVGRVRTTVGHLAEAGKEGFHVLLARYVHTINVKFYLKLSVY